MLPANCYVIRRKDGCYYAGSPNGKMAWSWDCNNAHIFQGTHVAIREDEKLVPTNTIKHCETMLASKNYVSLYCK